MVIMRWGANDRFIIGLRSTEIAELILSYEDNDLFLLV